MVSSSAHAADEAPPAARQPDWVVFSCGSQLLGAPLLQLREVLTPQPLTRLPGCGPEVGGLLGLRGRVVTVFDLGVLLEAGSSLQRDEHRLIVLDYGRRIAGFAVDAVIGVARGESAELSDVDAGEIDSGVADAAVGTGTFEGRRFVALDLNRMLGRLLIVNEESDA